MQSRLFALSLILAMLVACGMLCSTVESQQADPSTNDEQNIRSTAQKNSSAGSIDFKRELGLPFSSLTTLGGRIESSRRSHDPVGMAHAASELSVAEKVSGKTGSLTSTALMKEAAELAKLRREAAELQAVQHVASQVAMETDIVTDLKTQIAKAHEQAKAETDAIRRNLPPTDAPRKVLVNNYTTQYVDVWVNGHLKTQVMPGQSKWFMIEHKWNPTVLKGYGNNDNASWGPKYIWGRFQTYTWDLN